MKKLITLLFLILIPAAVFAMPPGGGRGGPGMGGPEGMGGGEQWKMQALEELDLTEEQRTQLKTLKSSKFTTKKKMLELQLERLNLRELIESTDSSEKEVFTQVEKINVLMAEANRERVKRMLALKGILTPDQFSKLQSGVRKQMGKGQRGGGHRGKGFSNGRDGRGGGRGGYGPPPGQGGPPPEDF